MDPTTFLYLGARDWQHAHWRGGFYPEDLPEDWVLSYYNTRFQTVYLPATRWSALGAADWQRWFDDTLSRFVFLLEPADARPPDSPRVVLATPGFTEKHVVWLEDMPDVRALARRIGQHAETASPLFLLSREGDLARLDTAENLRAVLGY